MSQDAPPSLFRRLLPLYVALLVIASAALALQGTGTPFMRGFMGLFFVTFAMFKLFDPKGFAESFARYDLLAGVWHPYGYAYPFLELILGLAWLGGLAPEATAMATIALMGFSAIGTWRGVRSGSGLTCACMGSLLSVPLSTVSVVENAGMGLMAAFMLIK